MVRSLTDGASYLSPAAAFEDWDRSVALARAFGVLKSPGAVRHCNRFNSDFRTLVEDDLGYKPGHEPVAFEGMEVQHLPGGEIDWRFYHNPELEAHRPELESVAETQVKHRQEGYAPHLAQAFQPTARSEFGRLLAATQIPDDKRTLKAAKYGKS